VKIVPLMQQPTSQADFAELIGVSEARVSQLVGEGIIARGDTAHEWVLGYCERLRDQAAGRMGDTLGGLDPAQESAALKRSQRIGQDLKNAVVKREYSPIGVLADVLAMASSSVVDRFDQLEGALKKACPNLPEDAKGAIMQVLASARNEWIRSTAKLVDAYVDEMVADAEEDADTPDEVGY
jgi:phage terminase Nu1 subunit (DNA packaging protein)